MSAARRRKKAWTRLLVKGHRARTLHRVRAWIDSPEFALTREALSVARVAGDLDGQRVATRAAVKGLVEVLARSVASEMAMVAIKKITRGA